jgi:hypothetical protein
VVIGYEPEEVRKANSSILHVPEDVARGKPRELLDAGLRDGKWEMSRLRTFAEAKHLNLELSFPDQVLTILTDRRSLIPILINQTNNAINLRSGSKCT